MKLSWEGLDHFNYFIEVRGLNRDLNQNLETFKIIVLPIPSHFKVINSIHIYCIMLPVFCVHPWNCTLPSRSTVHSLQTYYCAP